MDTKKLRQKILDLAIHGKLVPQDPNDEPASVLLERIRAEKERLISEGKIKRTKKSDTSDTSHYENVPFEVPKGWCWCRLEEVLSKLTDGSHNPPPNSGEGYPVISAMNIKKGEIDLSNVIRYVSEADYNKENARTQIKKGDIILGIIGGSIGNLAFYNHEDKVIAQRSIAIMTSIINSRYAYYVLKSNLFQKEFLEYANGSAQGGVYLGALSNMLFPLPPQTEQIRIVEEVEKWKYCIDQIECGSNNIVQSINIAKSKILDLAIHGKLVPQDFNDEPASELLKRINPKAIASCDNPHYGRLPENWSWINLGQLFTVVSAKRVTKDQWKSSGVPFYRTREIVQLSQNGFVDNELFIDEEHYKTLKGKYGIPQPGDIMLTAVGTIGKTYVVSNDDRFYYKDASVLCMKNEHKINSHYITMAFCSTFVQNQLFEKSKGTTVDTITIEKANNYIFPLPPIEEQTRIVSIVNKLFSQLDMIEKSLQA